MKRVKIPIEDAIGEAIPHDLTKIDTKGGFKGAYFQKGHIITKDDIAELRNIGKNFIYKIIPSENDIHEDSFAMEMAPLLAGKHISYSKKPIEGKIVFKAKIDGLFKVDRERLLKLNMIDEVSFPIIHDNFPVKKGEQVGAFRTIPLFTKKKILQKAKKIVQEPIIYIKPYKIKKANIIVTGTEVYNGLVDDEFVPKITKKLEEFGVKISKSAIVPDDIKRIQQTFNYLCCAELVVVTGGSSVDPDDVTKEALKKFGVKFIREGNPIQPANNLTIGYYGHTTVCVVPAGALFYKSSAFDIFLPRLLAGDKITKKDIAGYALGGLCHFCKVCVYPVCPFGKA
jgi:molybdenum cofactor synthesis domain-containing protein